MSIKTHELYSKYLHHLESQNLKSGSLELSKISASKFEDFKFRYENNPLFQEKIDNNFKQIAREEKIDEVMVDEFSLFLEELDKPVGETEDFDFDF
jgi:hypothetical protein